MKIVNLLKINFTEQKQRNCYNFLRFPPEFSAGITTTEQNPHKIRLPSSMQRSTYDYEDHCQEYIFDSVLGQEMTEIKYKGVYRRAKVKFLYFQQFPLSTSSYISISQSEN